MAVYVHVESSVFATGCDMALQQDPRRLERGYQVLQPHRSRRGIRISHGFSPGAARGIANSLIGYIDTLAPALGKEDGGKVDVLVLGETPFTVELGTYEEMAPTSSGPSVADVGHKQLFGCRRSAPYAELRSPTVWRSNRRGAAGRTLSCSSPTSSATPGDG